MKLLAAIFARFIPRTFVAAAIIHHTETKGLNPNNSIGSLFDAVAP